MYGIKKKHNLKKKIQIHKLEINDFTFSTYFFIVAFNTFLKNEVTNRVYKQYVLRIFYGFNMFPESTYIQICILKIAYYET